MEFVKAFVVGGLICVVGQLLIDLTKLTPARILVSFVTLGVILTGLGIYGPLVDFAGAGATVPLCGFGYTMAMGVQQAVQEKVCSARFQAASPQVRLESPPLSFSGIWPRCSPNPAINLSLPGI